VYKRDNDFGNLEVVDAQSNDNNITNETLPSAKIDMSVLSHLSVKQRQEILAVLDQFPDCFSNAPGLCKLVEHEISLTADFRPKRLKECRVSEGLKEEVRSQIDSLLKRGLIRPSKSPMASPFVCVLKGKDGKGGVRLTVNYQYLNKSTVPDVSLLPLPEISQVLQKVGSARYISLFDATSGYHQCPIREQDQLLSAFDDGLYEWTRVAFGMRSNGCTFVRALTKSLEPIRDFTYDMAVYSNAWLQHLEH
jgi:hypothetical protein